MKYAYVTTLNSDNYLIGAINVARKIKEFSKYPFYIIINSEIEKKYSNLFKKLHIETILMENIELSECIINNMKDTVYGHWINTFFKLNIFKLTSFDKIIYLDSDLLVLNNSDELFYNDKLSAVSDEAFSLDVRDGLNSGVMLIKPDLSDYKKLIDILDTNTVNKKYIGDQDVISHLFKDYHEINIGYNSCFYCLDGYNKNINYKNIHFIGAKKPWDWGFVYGWFRIYSYLIRGRIKTFKYTRKYFKELRKLKKYLIRWRNRL